MEDTKQISERERVIRLYCQDATKVDLPAVRPSWFTQLIDQIIRKAGQDGEVFQLPSFRGAKSIGIFSNYGGDETSPVNTYSFIFADFYFLEEFGRKIKEIRWQCGLSVEREIKFTELRSPAMQRALPLFLRAADGIPGFLFTLVVDKRVPSIIAKGASSMLIDQLTNAGFTSWQKKAQAERLVRVLHNVGYWMSFFGRSGMKTIWMTDHDNIHGRSSRPDEFKNVYVSSLALFGVNGLEIIGVAKPFESAGEQPFANELVSLADLVASGVAAFFTDQNGGTLHQKKHEEIGEICTFLDHQAVFLKKFTLLIQQSESGEPYYGLLSIDSNRSREGYTSVVFGNECLSQE